MHVHQHKLECDVIIALMMCVVCKKREESINKVRNTSFSLTKDRFQRGYKL